VGAFPVWRPNLDELDVDSAPASAFLILKSFKIIPLQLGCRVPARVLACLLSDGPACGLQRKNTRRGGILTCHLQCCIDTGGRARNRQRNQWNFLQRRLESIGKTEQYE
jgi:hypothetical protein